MRVGFSMLCFSGSTERQHLPLLERIAELGYDGVEVPVVGADPGWLEALARRLDELGLARTAVGFATAECDPISDDPAVRRAADEHLAGLVERSAILGADYLGGPIHSGYAVFGGGPATEEQLGRSAEALHRMAEVAGQHGNLRLGVEFLNRFECFLVTTAAETDALVERAEHPLLSTVYDTHHAHIEEESPAAALTACATSLGHVQVSESHRGVLGTGQVRWDETFAVLDHLGYDGWLVVECFSRSDPEFGTALHVWRDLAEAGDYLERGIDFVRARLEGL